MGIAIGINKFHMIGNVELRCDRQPEKKYGFTQGCFHFKAILEITINSSNSFNLMRSACIYC